MTHTPPRPVVCIGAVHYDTLAHASQGILRETSTPAVFSTKPGGVATNVARTLVKLGLETRLIGALGNDNAAKILTNVLNAEGIQFASTSRTGFSTGQYIAFHDPDGSLAAACVDDRVLSEAPADLLDRQLDDASQATDAIWFVDANLPVDLLRTVAEHAPKGRLIVNAVSNAKALRLKPVITKISCMMLNRGEAVALTGSSAISSTQNLIKSLRNMGANQIVLTDGSADILVHDGQTTLSYKPDTVKIVDVTGAGDALTAGTIAGLARGFDLHKAIQTGLKAASLTLRTTGALADGLSWDTLRKS
ncbi:MAG: PfkB family carbohydrate kinase [Roseibium sp.]